MKEVEPTAAYVRIGRKEGRRAERIGWIAVVLVVVAVLKPWGSAGDPPAPINHGPFATPVAEASDVIVQLDVPCIGGRWSIEADERWVGTVVRTWVLTDSIDVTGPEDERMTFVTVAAQQIIALGWCPPFHDAATNPTATFYRLDPDATIVDVAPVQMLKEAEAMANVLYRYAPRNGPNPGLRPSWPSGRYVIRIDADGGYRRWLGVNVVLVELPFDTIGATPRATVNQLDP